MGLKNGEGIFNEIARECANVLIERVQLMFIMTEHYNQSANIYVLHYSYHIQVFAQMEDADW